MTDIEIIKALGLCSSDEVGLCHICPLDGECNGDITILLKLALDLINSQKAEIENQSANIRNLTAENLQMINCIKRLKAEAIKEFARKLKCGVPQETGIIRCADIDNLVKEMVGESNA